MLLLAFLFAVPAHAGMCEQPGELYAAELVDAALLSSNLHTVRPCAEVRGHLARFTLDTPYGAIVADSVELLAVRVEELHALEALDERTLAGTAARAAAAEGEAAAKGVARIASNPVDTVKGAPLGAWRFFQRRVAKYAGRAQRLGQRVADESFDRGEAYDSVVARPGVRPVRGEPSPPWWRKTGREVARYARGEVGYGRARRTWSRRYGVDPYTTNPLLDARMDRLAWAAVAGEQAAGLAIGAVSGPAATVLSTSRRLNDWVWELSPEALADRNARRLAALRCGRLETRRFVHDGRFSPAQQTALVDALIELAPASGCDDVLELATALRGEIEARWLVAALRMALVEADGARVRLGLVGTSIVVRIDERVLLPLPADWLQWTPATADFFDAREWRVADKTVLIAGQASPIARRGLARRGFSVVERHPFAGAPPFRRDGYGAR